MRLDVAPACRVDWVRDVFGNSIALVDFLESAATLTIVSDVVLERLSPFPTRERHEPWHVPFPPRYDALEAAITAVYLQSTYLDDVPALQTWLRAEAPPDPLDAEGAMLALCRRVHAAIKYQRRVEKGVQTPAQTAGPGNRILPRHGHAADGVGTRVRRGGALRQRLPARTRVDGRGRLDARLGRGLPADARLARASIRRSATSPRPTTSSPASAPIHAA